MRLFTILICILLQEEQKGDSQKDDETTEDEEVKQEPVGTEDSDSNKLEDVIDTSLTVKSEVTGDDEEKQDVEKDVEESDVDLLQNDGDIKLEDLEEQNKVEDNKEVGLITNKAMFILLISDQNFSDANDMKLLLVIFPCIPLHPHCKLVPVQSREYECSFLQCFCTCHMQRTFT